MAIARTYSELFAWQAGEKFKLEVYRIVRSSTAATSDFRYRNQIFDAAGSVPANIAEGFARFSPGDFMRFLDYAVASLAEAELRLHDGIQLNYFPPSTCTDAFRLARRCTKASLRLKHSQKLYLEKKRRDKPNQTKK